MGERDKSLLEELIDVHISRDKLEATIQIKAWDKHAQLSIAELKELLSQHGVEHGLLERKLQEISLNPYAYRNLTTVVAKGAAPVHGLDGEVRLYYELDKQDQTKSPEMMQDGKVNFREIMQLSNVKKGQPIAKITPPTQGTHGKDVTGAEITAKDGKPAHFKLGKNVVVDKENLVMYAAIDGLVTKTDRDKINVFPVYEVNGDVDYHVGNIDFIGTVVVRGNVLPGFRIKAAGDIRIIGGVESGELEADGSIEISEGVLGHNKGFIKAGKTIKTSFVQDGNLIAGEDIIVTQSVMHSRVQAGGQVVCLGAKGLIVGGLIQAGEKVMARTIGNTTSTQTQIEVGALPEIREQLESYKAKLKASRDSLDKTEKALKLLDQYFASGQLSQEKLEMRIRLRNTKKQMDDEIHHLKDTVIELETKLEESNRAEVEVTSIIYAGIKIVIGRYTRFVKDPVRMVKFVFEEGEIKMIPTHNLPKG